MGARPGGGGAKEGGRRGQNDNNYTGKLCAVKCGDQAGVQLDTLCFTLGRQVPTAVSG